MYIKLPSILFSASVLAVIACNNIPSLDKNKKYHNAINKTEPACIDSCDANKGEMVCKLTNSELQKRKATVIADLKKKILDKKELKNGYAFKFEASDEILDELTDFVKAERQCCDFFQFAILVNASHSEVWLELTGEEGAKEFIQTELAL
jgi:hypothetical protein